MITKLFMATWFLFHLSFLGIIVYILYTSTKKDRSHAEDMKSMVKYSIDHLKATSLKEKVEAHALEKQHDTQLEMLRDALYEGKELPPEEEQMVMTDTGELIDLSEYEVL